MRPEPLELSVLLPCLNEARTVGKCVRDAMAFIHENRIAAEVLVADNGSTDGSPAIAESAGARVIHVRQRGYGAALAAGIRQAQGRFVVMADADDSYDLCVLGGFLKELRDGGQLVMGNRFKGGIAPGAMPPLHRWLGNPVLSLLGRIFFRVPVGDFHCGMRGFDRQAVLRLGLSTPGMEFASEMVAKAALARLHIREVPTTLRPDGRGRAGHLRTWRDGWRHLLFMLLYTPRWLFLIPGVLMLAVGLLGLSSLSTGTVSLAGLGLGLGIHTMLYMAAAVILGVQLVQLAFLTKWIGVVTGIVPKPAWLDRIAPRVRVESGLLVGLMLVAGGVVWSARLLYSWGAANYGPLDPTSVMRQAIPAVTMLIVGVQGIAGALFAGALHFSFRSLGSRSHDD